MPFISYQHAGASQIGIRELALSSLPVSANRPPPVRLLKRWIDSAHAAGLTEIVLGRLAPDAALSTQLNVAELIRHASTLDGLEVSVLVQDWQGAERAMSNGADRVLMTTLARSSRIDAESAQHPDNVARELEKICSVRESSGLPGVIEVKIDRVFGGTNDSRFDIDPVVLLTRQMLDCGADDVSYADTTATGKPDNVSALLTEAIAATNEKIRGMQFSDEHGQALANICASLELGISHFDACLTRVDLERGLAAMSRAVSTDALLLMLNGMQIDSGINLGQVLKLRDDLARYGQDSPNRGAISATASTGDRRQPALPRHTASGPNFLPSANLNDLLLLGLINHLESKPDKNAENAQSPRPACCGQDSAGNDDAPDKRS